MTLINNFQEKFFKNFPDTVAVFFNYEHSKDAFVRYLLGRDIDCTLIILKNGSKNGNNKLLVSSRDYDQVLSYGLKNLEVIKDKKLKEVLVLDSKNKTSIGLNLDVISVNFYNKINQDYPNIIDLSEFCDSVREIKTPEEIQNIKKSCEIADSILRETIKNFKKFVTELEAAEFINGLMKKLNVEPAFPTIIASGKNAAYPHHTPGKDKLRGFVVIDMGVKYNGYCSDITRTVYVGKPSKKEIEIYNVVLKSQESAIKKLKPGIKASEIDIACRKILGEYEQYFIHSLGHQFGIDVHESKGFRLHKTCEAPLKAGMLVTVEQGVYIPEKLGIRIEDDILITEYGYEVITKTLKELIIIDNRSSGIKLPEKFARALKERAK